MFLGTGTSQNTAPTAAFTAGCTGLSCSFDGRSSSDPDGSVASYAWNFGDGTTGSGATPQHAFGSAGTYTVTLTVKDDGGAASAPVSHSVTVSAQPSGGVAFVAATHAAGGNTRTKQVPVPNAAHAGDTAVLMLAQTSTASWSGPSGITGWAPVGTAPAGRLTTTLWTKQLTAGDLGGTVRFDSTGYTHAAASMAVYSGVSATQPVSAVAHSAATGGTSFVTPTATAGAGDFPVSLWADQASSPVTWSAQSGLVIRDASDDSGTTLTVQSLIADANASSTGGTVGGVEGRTSAAAAAVATWTLVLHSA
jgi:PKD repeat protein